MAQATIDYMKSRMNSSTHSSSHSSISTHTIGLQTNSDNFEFSSRFPNGRLVRLYYSTIYKNKVLSLNISDTKSFHKELFWKSA